MRVQLHATQAGLALYKVGDSDTAVIIDTEDMNAFDPVSLTAALSQGSWVPATADFQEPGSWHELATEAADEFKITVKAPEKQSNRTYKAPKKVVSEVSRGLSAYQVLNASLDVNAELVSLAKTLVAGAPVSGDDLRPLAEFHASGLGTRPQTGETLSGSNVAYLLTGGTAGREWVSKISTQSAELAQAAAPAPAKDSKPQPPVKPTDSAAPPSDAPDGIGKQTTDPNDPNGWIDVTKPHKMLSASASDATCVICGQNADGELHNPDAIAKFQAQLDGGGVDDPAAVAAAGVDYNPSCTYFAKMAGPEAYDAVAFDGEEGSDDPETPPPGADEALDAEDPSDGTTVGVTNLMMKDPDDVWAEFDGQAWSPTEPPSEDDEVVELDAESVHSLAEAIASALSGDLEPGADGNMSPTPSADNPAPAPVKILGEGIYGLSLTEAQLFKNAEPFLNLSLYDSVFGAVPYVDPAVRSKNAQSQPRQSGGKFGSGGSKPGSGGAGTGSDSAGGSAAKSPAPDTGGQPSATDQDGNPTEIARLQSTHELLADVPGRIQQYADENASPTDDTPAEAAPNADDAPVTAAGEADPALTPPVVDSTDAAPAGGGGPDSSSVTPLYLAEVDPNDTQAVLKLIAIIPADPTSGTDVEAYVRKGDTWTASTDELQILRGPTPPPTVEITDPAELQDVESQIAESTSSGSTEAEPADGATPTATADTTAGTVAASGIVAAYLPNGEVAFATLTTHTVDDKGELSASQSQGAVLLQPYTDDMSWPADVTQHLDEFVAGKEVSPKDHQNAERLRRYWTHGEGGAKIRWGEPGDWKRCTEHLGKYMGERAKGYCTLRHKDATGFYPGHAPTEQRPHAQAASAAPLALKEDGWIDHGVFAYTAHERRAMAKTGEALADGSFPIRNKPDLEKALKEYPTLQPGDRELTRKHILKRARALDLTAEVPAPWKTASSIDLDATFSESMVASAGDPDAANETAAVIEMAFSSEDLAALGLSEFKTFSPEQREKLAKKGEALPDGSFPIKNKGDLSRAVQAHGRAKNKSAAKKHIIKRAKALGAQKSLPDSWRAAAAIELAGDTVADVERKTPDTVEQVQTGARFKIPLLIPEGVSSGDGRTFAENSVTSRETPLALMWQIESDDGHKRSVIVGRIDHIERIPSGVGNCYGVFDTGEYGQEAERMVRAGMLRGVSADLDEFEAQVLEPDEDDTTVTSTRLTVNKGRVMGATLVAKPAFPDVVIELIDEGDDVDDFTETTAAVTAAALVAAAAPIAPPAGWFQDPKLSSATPLTVDDEGRVYGHIALWDVDHIGLPFGTRAPRSASNYAYFRTGVVRAAEGTDIPVGQLTLSGGHASLAMTASEAVRHYDDTNSAVADVAAGEDRFGIWVAGSMRPSVTPEQVRTFRASAPSGDWRPIRGKLELVAVCQVNVPGFPVARARVASGMVQALVAAGASPLLDMKIESMAASAALSERVASLEAATRRALQAEAEATRARMNPAMSAHREALTAAAETARARVESRRAELAAAAEQVKNRFAALRPVAAPVTASAETINVETPEKSVTVPVKVSPNITINVNVQPGADVDAIKDAIVAALDVVPPFEEHKHPRDKHGKFAEIIGRLSHSLKDVGKDDSDSATKDKVQGAIANLHGAADMSKEGDDSGAAKAVKEAQAELKDVANAAQNAEDKVKLDEASDSLDSLLEHLASMGNQGEGIHFNDLPEPIKEVVREAADTAESRLKQTVDPTKIAPLMERLDKFLKNAVPLTPDEIAQILGREVQQATVGEVKPRPVQSAPSPGNPTGG